MPKQNTDTQNDNIVGKYDDYVMPIWKNLNVPIKRATDCTVEDYEGNEYFEVFSGISATNVGHTNDAVVQAAKDQLDDFVHGCSYVHPSGPVADLGGRLASITPGDLQKSFFCNSGTEAVEGTIKLARKHTGSKEIVALEMGFHGRTLGSLALTGNNAYKKEMAPTLNDVSHISPPYEYRCQICDGGSYSSACADQLAQVIGSHTSGDLAAVIVEPVMGEAGIIVPPEGWLRRIQEITHEHGGLLIVDEVQTGYGRTGEMFATDHFAVVHDIMAQAKGIANGLPLGAFTAPEDIADAFGAGDHLSTFGGNLVACAAALAAIDELERGIIENARNQGEWLSEQLAHRETTYGIVGDTRGLGLMQGVEVVDPNGGTGPLGVAPKPAPTVANLISDILQDDGILMGVGGYHKNVMRIQPPLTIDRDQLRRAVEGFDEALAEVAE